MSYRKLFFFLLLFLCFCLYAGDRASADSQPFSGRNLNPFVLVHGLPPQESGRITQPQEFSGRIVLEAANSFSLSETGREKIVLDGETYRATLSFLFGVKERLEFGVHLPYISHSHGVFDHFIDDWHDFFGLPEGDRPTRERGLLEYRYERDGTVRHCVSSSSAGVGDILLAAAYQVKEGGRGETPYLALRSALKVPTGSAAALRGSKGFDFSLYAAYLDDASLAPWRLTIYGSAGGLLLGNGEVLESIKKEAVVFASLGLAWDIWKSLTLKLQADGHTPFYDSELDELGLGAIQLNMGGTVSLTEKLRLDINVVEDLLVAAAPDVVFYLALRKVF